MKSGIWLFDVIPPEQLLESVALPIQLLTTASNGRREWRWSPFARALARDPSSYRAAIGLASVTEIQRDFDITSRAFDAARRRTRDRDEQRFLSAAIGDLATIRVR